MKLVLSIPGFNAKSNGLNVFHAVARQFKNLGAEVRIIPWSMQSDIYEIPEEYKDLYDARFDLSDAIAFLPDAIPEHIAQQIKSQTTACVWWLCNVPGLLGHNPCHFEKDDLLLSYSKLVSGHLPQFYYHHDIYGLPPLAEIIEKRKNADLVVVYGGKGCIRPIPPEIADNLPSPEKIIYISRFFPETKEVLHSLLLRAKFVICFDPISFLAYEANMLGAPVFLVNHMRPKLNLQQNFNIPLHGFFTNVQDFIEISKVGLDVETIHKSHRKALETNEERVKEAFEFIENWAAGKNSVQEKFRPNVASIYNELVGYELPELKRTIDATIGSTRNLSKREMVFLRRCVEKPQLAFRKQRFFAKLKRSFYKRLLKIGIISKPLQEI